MSHEQRYAPTEPVHPLAPADPAGPPVALALMPEQALALMEQQVAADDDGADGDPGQQPQPPRSSPFFLKTPIEVASKSIESVGENRSARASGGQNATASSTSSS